MNDLIERITKVAKKKAEDVGLDWGESFSLIQITEKLGNLAEQYTFPRLGKEIDPDGKKRALAELVLMCYVLAKVVDIDLEEESVKRVEQLEKIYLDEKE
jgi:hypothetical protein